MKVYVVTSGEYAGYAVDAIFSTREGAEAYIERFPATNCNGVEEWDVDVPLPDKSLSPWDIFMAFDGSVFMAFDGSVRHAHVSYLHPRDDRSLYRGSFALVAGSLAATVWARDEQHAVKIANEKRAQMIAKGEWKPEGQA